METVCPIPESTLNELALEYRIPNKGWKPQRTVEVRSRRLLLWSTEYLIRDGNIIDERGYAFLIRLWSTEYLIRDGNRAYLAISNHTVYSGVPNT